MLKSVGNTKNAKIDRNITLGRIKEDLNIIKDIKDIF